MSLKMFQILVSALLFTASVLSVLGAPFLAEESANQFMRLKRHIPYSLSYWDSSSRQNTWAYTVAEQLCSMGFLNRAFHRLGACVYLMTTSDPTWSYYSSLGLTSNNKLLNPTHLVSGRAKIWPDVFAIMYLIR
ncbi:uncharacterized protein C3orf85 homolog isoform X1 [Vidua chalybeata]|uniref:uncharacterized protein C3orf85 homolog isoform X1 n=1 Tax=Vidua chalybeata TaxID=81927 RepID=UPI0023A8BE09|nr:uncharacterized protein C3orf85 homolog isoform X1 [Vidua chalybeata]